MTYLTLGLPGLPLAMAKAKSVFLGWGWGTEASGIPFVPTPVI